MLTWTPDINTMNVCEMCEVRRPQLFKDLPQNLFVLQVTSVLAAQEELKYQAGSFTFAADWCIRYFTHLPFYFTTIIIGAIHFYRRYNLAQYLDFCLSVTLGYFSQHCFNVSVRWCPPTLISVVPQTV